MANKEAALTPIEIVELFDLYEGTGSDSIETLLTKEYGDDLDTMVRAWCLEKYGLELDVDPAYEKLYEWVEKENVPLKGKYLELCQKQVQDGIDGDNGNSWLNAHSAAVIRYALVENFDEKLELVLSDFAEYVYADVMDGLPSITNFQYFESAKSVIKANVERLIEKNGMKGIFESALYMDEGYLGNPKRLLKEYVERHPEHKVALVEALLDHSYIDLEEWLCTESWYLGLEEAFTIKAKEIYKKACVGWDCEGEDVLNELSTAVRQALAKGGVGSDEILDDAEMAAELAELKAVSPTPQVGAELLSRIDAMEKAGVSSRDILIRTGYYTEGCDYGQANIDFFSAKLAAQKTDGSWEKAQQESKVRQAELTEKNPDDFEFDGMRVCITGKLTATRNEIEGWLSDAGATVVSGVSKTTDALIVGEKAGGKLDKAKELGIKILSEEEALDALAEVVGEIADEDSERIIDKLIDSVADSTAIGYFKFKDKEEARILEAQTKEEVRAWLEEWVDQYSSLSDALAARLMWVELNQKNNVTVWYYDEECSDSYDSDICVRSFNSNSDARAFIENVNDSWGGHLSTIKVIHKTGDKFKVQVGSELEKAGFKRWDYDYQRIFYNLESYPELKDLLSSNIEEVFKEKPADAEAELNEIVRKGLWPTLKTKDKNSTSPNESAVQKASEEQIMGTDEVEDSFYMAIDDCDFDTIFNEAEKYKALILENINDLASNFAEDTPFEATGGEPQWLLSALLKAGAEFGGGDSDDGDEDEDEPVVKTSPSPGTTKVLDMWKDNLDNYKKTQAEKEGKKQLETAVITFKEKRICVTGKLSSTRSEVEQLIKDMGGIVASGVSKTTDYLIAGEDAGSKLAKAAELGIPVLSEAQAARVFNEDDPPLTVGGLDETTRWANGWDGIWFKGNYYVSQGGDHEVYVTISKEYWQKEFQGKEGHTVGTDSFSGATWCIDFGCSDLVSEDLCEELFGEEGPFEWFEMNEEQQKLIAKTSLERGEFKYMRHLGIQADYTLAEYGDAMPDEAYAEVLGLDPEQTDVSMQG